jgi:hypothetical protein
MPGRTLVNKTKAAEMQAFWEHQRRIQREKERQEREQRWKTKN